LKRVSFIRHAKSETDNKHSDYYRPLNIRGTKDASIMSKRLFSLYGKPDLIICSGAIRALTTAEFFATNCNYQLEKIIIKDSLYLASSSKIIQVINSIDNKYSNVWIFSHNPGISEAVIELTERVIELKTCCVCTIEKDTNYWHELDFGNCHLIKHICPKDNLN